MKTNASVSGLPLRSILWAFSVIIPLVAGQSASAAPSAGELLYQKQCASCHGKSGEGAKEFPRALAGDKSLPQLSQLIAKTMPEDDPESLSKAQADAVAAYIYDAFYSKAAREQNKPPRVELARLTVGQYRNTVADVIGSFRAPMKWDDKRGLHGEYYNSRNIQANKRVIDRTDPVVEFDFGTAGPAGGKFDDQNQFSIRWEGSVLAPETGDYEFIVRTDHATRLWVNDITKPLIDAFVKSGNDNEYHASIFLLAGRAYSLRLDFSKAKQGVDDSKKMKEKPPVKASMALLWKLPKRAAEIIPACQMTPARSPETYVATTPFPPDDRSLGWVRGTTISKAWDQSTTDAAFEAAAYVVAHLNELTGTKDGAADRDAKVRDFCLRFAERAFRQPLTDEQKALFVERQFKAAKDPEAAVKRVVVLALKSPHFLYREIDGPGQFAVANRLSFALWDAPPDQELQKAAAAGLLKTREQLVKQAERMLADPRARAKFRDFLLTWLKVELVPDVAKDPKRFPGFDAAIVTDLRTSIELFLDDVIWSEASDFRQLLLADELYLNGRLAKYYGANLPADAGFQKVKLNADKRAGVLTHPYLMATFAYTGSSSPIHRGLFVARGVLGLSMRPPPEAVTPLTEELQPKLTTRERVTLQTKAAACISCHGVINPLGFTLEHFDAVGRYRDKENNKSVDSSGAYQTRAGETKTFHDVRDMAKFLASSEEVYAAFVEQLFHHLVKQPVRAYGVNRLVDLRESFAKNGFSVRKLAVEIAAATALAPAPADASPAKPAVGVKK
jgi:cytochrome c553